MSGYHRQALDYAQAGQWKQAHELIQKYSDHMSCLIHGYLHRVEGDLGNARYWYSRAGAEMPDNSLTEELSRLRRLAGAD